MSTSRFFTGTLIGLAAGMLLAPKRGKDLRNDISDQTDKVKRGFDRITGKIKRGPGLSDLRSILEDEVNGLSDDVRYRLLSILDESEEGIRNVRRAAI
jgi:gas vesicle protein